MYIITTYLTNITNANVCDGWEDVCDSFTQNPLNTIGWNLTHT